MDQKVIEKSRVSKTDADRHDLESKSKNKNKKKNKKLSKEKTSRGKHSKKKSRKRRVSSSSDSTSSSDSSSSSEDEKARKRKKKMKKKKAKKRKAKLEESKSKADIVKTPLPVPAKPPVPDADVGPHIDLKSSKIRAPMTKEEYEKQQSTLKWVTDPETGRKRLIRGSGEIMEEIVSKERHQAINKQATSADGNFFQNQSLMKARSSYD